MVFAALVRYGPLLGKQRTAQTLSLADALTGYRGFLSNARGVYPIDVCW